MSRAARLALLALVAAVAVFFRLHRIDTVPPGLFIDEAQDALDAAAIRRGDTFPVMVEAGAVKGRTREPMLHYLMAATFTVAGTSVRSIRLTVALIGIATVILFFLLCEHLFGVRVAVLAAFLLAVCRWHVTMSRVGVRAVLTPLFIVLTLLALEGLVRRRTLGAAPAVCVISAFGLDAFAGVLGRRRRLAGSVFLAAGLIAIAAWNYRDYFSVWVNRDDVAGSYGVDLTHFFTLCANLADDTDVYLAPYIYKSPTFEFLRLERGTSFHLLDSTAALIANGHAERDRVFVLDAPPLTEMIEALYPEHEVVARYAVWGQRGGVVLRVQATTLAPALTPAQTTEAELWIGRMRSDFEAMARDW